MWLILRTLILLGVYFVWFSVSLSTNKPLLLGIQDLDFKIPDFRLCDILKILIKRKSKFIFLGKINKNQKSL